MTKHSKKGAGGKRKGSGRKPALHRTVRVSVFCREEYACTIKQAMTELRDQLQQQAS